jgi:peptidoglycan/LPS O-acetylase OafA/YrhL
MAGAVATTVAVSALLFAFIETPARRAAKGLAHRLAAKLSPRALSA